jgi:hypothetical protein
MLAPAGQIWLISLPHLLGTSVRESITRTEHGATRQMMSASVLTPSGAGTAARTRCVRRSGVHECAVPFERRCRGQEHRHKARRALAPLVVDRDVGKVLERLTLHELSVTVRPLGHGPVSMAINR